MKRAAVTAMVFLVAAVLATSLRGRIREERRALKLTPRVDRGLVEQPLSGLLAERQVVLLSAGLGVFRALAIDFLWVRAIRLQEKGSHFEAAALSRLITGLQPRLPEVWNFEARNLAYNISPAFPPEERLEWVLAGMRLLRDDALRFNPGSPSIHLDLAILFQHKIGLDFDEAGYLYRSALASAFEVDRGSPPGRARFAEWKLDLARIKALEEKHGAPLDFRAAESHAVYWAEKGLEAGNAGGGLSRWYARRLGDVMGSSIWQLFHSGRPLRSPRRTLYAFLPDTRFEGALDRRLREELERAAQRGTDAAAEAEYVFRSFRGAAVVYACLEGREEEAKRAFDAAAGRILPAGANLDEVLVLWATEGGAKAKAPVLGGLLEAALILEEAGEPSFSRGFRRLAARLEAALRREGAPAPSIEECLEAARIHRAERSRRAEPPREAELPFRLEVLDLTPPGRRGEGKE